MSDPVPTPRKAVRAGESVTADVWFQVGGLRKLVAQACCCIECVGRVVKVLEEPQEPFHAFCQESH
eukprot:1206481-Amphidinium_carterae.1